MVKKTVPMLAASALIGLLVLTTGWAENFGMRKRRPKPHEYGTTVIDTASTENGIAAVAFPHWLHRSKYTCRLCHVDIGGPEVEKNCVRCHSVGRDYRMKNDFYAFRKSMPRQRFGNTIDWVKAEDEGLIKPVDILDRVSIERPKLENPVDESLTAKEVAMPDIVFSHTKHTVWNGCEVCHPQIFGVKKTANVYSMQQIFDGLYCGACHGKVSFPNDDCQRCHTKPVVG